MQALKKIIEKIHLAENILLLTHENPDGDAIGSIMALFLVLTKQLAKKAQAACPSYLPRAFTFLPANNNIKRDFILGDYQLIIILDCGDLRRTGFAERIKELVRYKKRIINIDHHSRNDVHKVAQINYVDYEASSTAELIYRLLKELGTTIDRDIATSLFCGLYTDTGGFRHSNTTPTVFRIAAELLRSGARLQLITNNISNSKSVTTLKLWGLALSRIRHDQELGLISSVITLNDLRKCQADPEDLAGVVNLINTIPEARASILFSEIEPGKIKASLRTEKNNIDVSRFAALFGGGGLKKAAGFTIDGKIVSIGNGEWAIEI